MLALALLVVSEPVLAQRRGGGMRGGGMRGGGMRAGGGMRSMPRATARPSVTSRPSMSRPSMATRPNIGGGASPAVNRGNINPNISRGDAGRAISNRNLSASDIANFRGNTNINRPVVGNDINIDNGGRWDGYYNGCCYHPIATGVGIAAGAALTAAAIGSVVYALPPDCVVSTVGYTTYQHCGDVWYEPQFDGTTTTYVVVNPPQ
jgi:hypothetical protein